VRARSALVTTSAPPPSVDQAAVAHPSDRDARGRKHVLDRQLAVHERLRVLVPHARAATATTASCSGVVAELVHVARGRERVGGDRQCRPDGAS